MGRKYNVIIIDVSEKKIDFTFFFWSGGGMRIVE